MLQSVLTSALIIIHLHEDTMKINEYLTDEERMQGWASGFNFTTRKYAYTTEKQAQQSGNAHGASAWPIIRDLTLATGITLGGGYYAVKKLLKRINKDTRKLDNEIAYYKDLVATIKNHAGEYDDI